jgi:hypothetical protein
MLMTDNAKSNAKKKNAARKKTGNFEGALPDKIGSSLRTMYDEVLREDIPEDFLNLLQKADDVRSSKPEGDSK